MENTILKQYYKGLLNQINSEVNLINRVFQHNGLTGEGNENVIKNLLIKFIPKKYGISSGIVIDRNGNQSKQCDIVVYDNQNYPELLSMSSVKLFPVDIVYATIEVKTRLDSGKSKIAVENINSVSSLDYIVESFRIYPTEPVKELNDDTTFFETRPTTRPIGLIFAYSSTTNRLGTFMNWFDPLKFNNINHFPSHICCLDQGILVINQPEKRVKPFVFPAVTGEFFHTVEANERVKVNGKDWCNFNGEVHPYSEICKDKVMLDQSKTLLNFILFITELLQNKFISPRLDLRKQYLTEELLTMFTVQNNKLCLC